MRRIIAVITVLATSMFGVISMEGAASAATSIPVVCGATITADTTLHRDLVDCPDNGLVIAADNVTVNLNGHKIDGNESPVDKCPTLCDVGVNNTAGHAGLVILGGSIQGFSTGVLVIGGDANRLRNLAVSRNLYSGVVVANSNGSLVQGCSIIDNGLTTDQAGMDLFNSHDTLIQGNTISRNGGGLQAAPAGGVNRIVDNVISDNPGTGIGLVGTANEISRNRLDRNGDGMELGGDENTITRNLVTDALGCSDGCGYGISLEGGTNNLIAANVVARSKIIGIRVDAYGGVAGGTVVRGNIVRGAGWADIAINPDHVGPVTDTLLTGNYTFDAGHDGIDVQSASTTLSRNIANNNGNLGIEAVSGVKDGGGNHARNNNNPMQCTNVDC